MQRFLNILKLWTGTILILLFVDQHHLSIFHRRLIISAESKSWESIHYVYKGFAAKPNLITFTATIIMMSFTVSHCFYLKYFSSVIEIHSFMHPWVQVLLAMEYKQHKKAMFCKNTGISIDLVI